MPDVVAAAYYRGAMGILLVYDVTDEASFNNVRNWMKNIETHASSTVNKVMPVWAASVLASTPASPASHLQSSAPL